MALTRDMLKGLDLTEEQIGKIIDGHTDTVQALKKERDEWKEKAKDAETYKKERDDLQKTMDAAKGGTDWKAEYDKLKAATEAKETASRLEAAYRKLLTDAKVDEDMIDSIISVTKFDGMKLDKDGSIHDADKLTESITTKYAKFIVTEGTKTPPVKTPPDPKAPAFESMNLTQKMEYANLHPNDPAVASWLKNPVPPTKTDPAKEDGAQK